MEKGKGYGKAKGYEPKGKGKGKGKTKGPPMPPMGSVRDNIIDTTNQLIVAVDPPSLKSITKIQASWRGQKERMPSGRPKCTGEIVGDVFPVPPQSVDNPEVLWFIAGDYKTLTDQEFQEAFDDCSAVPSGWKPVTREVFKKYPKWKQQQALKYVGEKPPFTYDFPHAEIRQCAIDHVDWEKLLGVQRSSAGSEGVLFVEFPASSEETGKQGVVVKAPSKVAAEMYGTLLCQRLEIPCPEMRLVVADSEEGKRMKEAMIKFDQQRQAADQTVADMLNGKAAFLVIEYLKATELAEKYVQFHADWIQNTFGASGALSAHGIDCLNAMGKLICFDMIINNYDRLPCVWQNQGNPGNVMFDDKSSMVISIDNMMCCIHADSEKQLNNYMANVRETTIAVVSKPTLANERFKKIRKFLLEGCPDGHGWLGLGIDIGEEGVCKVQDGFLETLQLITGVSGDDSDDIKPLTKKELHQMEASLHKQVYGDDATHELKKDGFEAIDTDFMGQVLDIFRQICPEGNRESGEAVPTSPKGCHLNYVGVTNSGWRCAGANEEGGCLSAVSQDAQTEGWSKYESSDGSYSLCVRCYHRAWIRDHQLEQPGADHTPVEVEWKTDGWGRDFENDAMVLPCGTNLPIAPDEAQKAAGLKKLMAKFRSASKMTQRLSVIRIQLKKAADAKAAKGSARNGSAVPIYTLEQLQMKPWPEGVAPALREIHLSDEDFLRCFNMGKDAWSKLPQWRKNAMKKAVKLF